MTMACLRKTVTRLRSLLSHVPSTYLALKLRQPNLTSANDFLASFLDFGTIATLTFSSSRTTNSTLQRTTQALKYPSTTKPLHQLSLQVLKTMTKLLSTKHLRNAPTSPHQPPTFIVYVPQFAVEHYNLLSTFESLKDSAHRSEVLFGFVISLLGGVVHLSYPPTLDESKLYCEILVLFEHHGLPMPESLITFANLINDLSVPQPVPIPPYSHMLIELAEFVWVMCSQNRTCLSLLVPYLSNQEASSALLRRLGQMSSQP